MGLMKLWIGVDPSKSLKFPPNCMWCAKAGMAVLILYQRSRQSALKNKGTALITSSTGANAERRNGLPEMCPAKPQESSTKHIQATTPHVTVPKPKPEDFFERRVA